MGLCRTASIVALAAYYSVLVGRIYSLQVQVRCYPEYTQNTIIMNVFRIYLIYCFNKDPV